MRVFGGEGVKNMMGRFGIPEDEPLVSGMVSRALENAQQKIEGFHFDARKHTLQYDDVLNKQRTSMYERRRKVLFGDEDYLDGVLSGLSVYKEGIDSLIIEKEKKYGRDLFRNTVRTMLLQIIDTLWMDHLDQMEHMRSSVNLRAYGQRDPLVEYKKEGLRMFKSMEVRMMNDTVLFIENMDSIFASQEARAMQARITSNQDQEKVGRNDPCPCGSGKKWKKCGELNTEEHQANISKK
jgi:preprotein translocase subunit SecA